MSNIIVFTSVGSLTSVELRSEDYKLLKRKIFPAERLLEELESLSENQEEKVLVIGAQKDYRDKIIKEIEENTNFKVMAWDGGSL